MRLIPSGATLIALLLSSAPRVVSISRDGRSDHDTISIYGWPLQGDPTPIALIKLDPLPPPAASNPIIDNLVDVPKSRNAGDDASSNRTATVFNYAPHKMMGAPSELIRVGILEPATQRWSGSVVGREAFDNSKYDRKFVLHYDRGSGRVWHVHLLATAIPKLDSKARKKLIKEIKKRGGDLKEAEDRVKGQTSAVVVTDMAGPKPVLNKPVVVAEDGKVEGAEGGDQRTFLQKYWWAIALFLLVNVLAGGGAPEEKS